MEEKNPRRDSGGAEPETNNNGSITRAIPTGRIPKCIYCGTVRESFTGDPCPCPSAKALRAAREQSRKEDNAMIANKPTASIAPPLPARDDGLAALRRQAAKERADAAKDADLADRDRAIRERELSADRERRQDAKDAAYAPLSDTTGTDTNDGIIPWDDEIDLTPGPAVLDRVDGVMVLPAGKLSWAYGLPGSGKSWLDLIAAHMAVLKGGYVLMMDFEDSKKTFQQRALLIGFDVRVHADAIKWADQSLADSPENVKRQQEWLASAPDPVMSLVVIDAAESSGCPSNGDDVNPWLGKMVKPWRDVGAGVHVTDHIPKRADGRPDGPIGSQRKLAAIDGIALVVSGIPWTRHKGGSITLTNQKDRTGEWGNGATVAVIVGTYHTEADGQQSFAYTIEAPNATNTAEDTSMGILQAVEDAGPAGVSGSRNLVKVVGGKASTTYATINTLVDADLLNKTRVGKADVFTLTAAGLDLIQDD